MEQRLRQVPLVPDFTSDEDGLSLEEQITLRKKEVLKLGMDHTGATLVKKCIEWPHEGLVEPDGKPAVYGDLTLVTFVRGCLMVLNCEMDTRLKAQMS